MAFPTTLSNYLTGANSATLAAAGHATNHNALEAKVGIDNSAVATSLDYKINHIETANITDITASAAEINKLDGLATTAVELGYVNGVTSAIQTQLGTKAPLASPTFTGTVTMPTGLTGLAKMTSGVVSAVTAPSGTVVGTTDTQTLTNKRHTPRIYTTSSIAGTPGVLTPEIDTYDYFEITAQAAALNIANHSTSSPTGGESIVIAITSDATPRALTYGTNYVAKGGVALPSTTVASKTTTLGFKWNAGLTKWNLLAVGQEA